jgi:hypothetical protein
VLWKMLALPRGMMVMRRRKSLTQERIGRCSSQQ